MHKEARLTIKHLCHIFHHFRIISLLLFSLAATQQETKRVLRVVGNDNYAPFLSRDPAGRAVGNNYGSS